MHLKTLEMTGFKSFAEAKIEFPTGITAVVGPNGTGKSNVVDAILWVLGEQSTKTLRSERMEDVIFNGTEARKAMGMAEVSLIIGGLGAGKIGGVAELAGPLSEYEEVMITRRLYRNGDSEYLMNKTQCRLKDIRSLLLDTRAGIKGHTIIEQGRIDQILNASPQDRRELIEETAGIIRYKKQKAEALRRLDATQHNLLRVRDIVTEVRRQLNSLERQARQARAYKRLHDEAKDVEVRLLLREARTLLETQRGIDTELQILNDAEAGHAAKQGSLASQLEDVRHRMNQAETVLHGTREELARIEHERSQAVTAVEVERSRLEMYEQQRVQGSEELQRLRLEQERGSVGISQLRAGLAEHDAEMARATQALSESEERGQTLAKRRAALMAEESQARQAILDGAVQATNSENQLGQMEATRDELARIGSRLADARADLERQRDDTSQKLQAAVAARQVAERQLHMFRQEREAKVETHRQLAQQVTVAGEQAGRCQAALAAAESRLRALEGVVREEMGYGRAGEEATTSLKACEGIHEAVAEWLVVPPGLERAVEAVLGERGRAWLVETPGQACRAIEFLKENGLGRGAFIPVRPRSSGPWADVSGVGGLATAPGVRGWARDLVTAREGSTEALAYLFDGVLIVETLEVALTLWERGTWSAARGPNRGPCIVTLAGEVVDAAGTVTGGEIESSGGLLQRRQEVQQLSEQRIQLTSAEDASKETRARLAAEAESLGAAQQRLEDEMHSVELRVLALGKDEEGLGQKLEELAKNLETRKAEQQKGEEDRGRLQSDLGVGQTELSRLRQEQAVREAGLAELSATLSAIEQKNIECQGHVTEGRLKVSSLEARREHDEIDLARLVSEQEEREARITNLDEHVSTVMSSARESEAERERNESLARDLGQQADDVRAGYIAAQEAQARDQESSLQLEAELDEVRQALASNREARTGVEVRRAEVKTRLQTLADTLSGTYDLSLAVALEQAPESAEHGEAAEGGSEEERSEEELCNALREQLQNVRRRLERMGPINLAAIEEHEALEERHKFLTTQEEDLANSIKSLKEIIHRINRTTQRMFEETFTQLQEKFGEVFARLFPGGRAELVLVEAPTDPEEGDGTQGGPKREPGVDVVAQPSGKRLKNITMLSGGEKTLTAMALIFASFLIRPTPFCILDEIDAPLDEENIGRFTTVLRELATRAQFIVITHNKRSMAMADSLFGVTMDDPGVSTLLSIRLADLQPA